MMDRNTGRPRGFGFVTFEDPAVAEVVCSQKHELNGRQVGLAGAPPPEHLQRWQ